MGDILMEIDKRIIKNERKTMENVQELCGAPFRRVDMNLYEKVENLYNFNQEGHIIMLGLDLMTLNLDENKLQILGESVRKFEFLERFLIRSSDNKILPKWLEDLRNLKALIINDSFLTDIPDGLKELKKLSLLNLLNNEIKVLPEWLPSLSDLKELNLGSKIPNLEVSPQNIEILKALHNKNVKVNDSVFRMHFELGLPIEQIKIIRDIKNAIGYNIVRSYKLDSADDKYIMDKFVIDLRVLNGKIAHLGMVDYKLKELPKSFGKIDGLLKLVLSQNQLESLPDSIGELNELKELDLSKNELKILPESFVNLKSLTKLDLSNNQLGEIPTQLWALKELAELKLDNNPLSNEENIVIQKVPDLIREYLRKKATIKVFISHAVIDFEPYQIRELVEYLEKQKEISQVYFCEEDLAGNIDEWMLNAVQECQLILFVGTNKSVFNSPDCANELQLADKFSIPIIPIKGYDVSWQDLAEKNLSRELGLEFNKDDFGAFCEDLYRYIENFKREINLMEKEERRLGIIDIYERFRLMLDEKLDDILRKINNLGERISTLEKR